MNRNLLIATLVVASVSAKAQTTIEKPPVAYSKCFCEVKPFKYQLFAQSESLTVGDTTYTLDWATREVIQNGTVFKMQEINRFDDAVEVVYDERVITFLYDKKKKFLDYILER